LRPEDAAHEFRQPGLGAVSRALAGVALLWVPVLALHLTPALFAVLITCVGAAALGLAMFIALAGGAAVVAVESAAEASVAAMRRPVAQRRHTEATTSRPWPSAAAAWTCEAACSKSWPRCWW
jgi:hypothetical protein